MTVPEHQQVQVETEDRGGQAVTVVSGEVDAATADAFEQALRPAIADSTTIVLDLSGVSFMDSSGLRSLMAIHSEVTARDGRIQLADTSSVVDRLLSVTGLDELFTRAD
jgi:anti-anti-sigma factor